ncbi:hypothetical protein GF343_03400 [Candidatus Woesearchaeota archaeon]|nr:hypothetical protein [Candidatus Woesearchaeota archaeon]
MPKSKESPAEIKKAVIDLLLKRDVRDQPLLDLAVLEPGIMQENVLKRITHLNRVVDTQIKTKGATPSLKAQKKIITEIIKEIEKEDTTSQKLKELLRELKAVCIE